MSHHAIALRNLASNATDRAVTLTKAEAQIVGQAANHIDRLEACVAELEGQLGAVRQIARDFRERLSPEHAAEAAAKEMNDE